MADAVSTTVMFNGSVKYVVHLTNLSDGTGETNVVKVDKSTLIGPGPGEPSYLVLEKIKYDCIGMRVYLSIDRTSDLPLMVLQGFGQFDFRDTGGLLIKGTGDTGDILLSTANMAAGDSYDVTLYLRKKE